MEEGLIGERAESGPVCTHMHALAAELTDQTCAAPHTSHLFPFFGGGRADGSLGCRD